MPRGSTDGSIIRKRAVAGNQPGYIILRKRYTDSKGRRREKKRIAHTDAEALRLRRDIEREIKAERGGISPLQMRAFNDLVEFCLADEGQPEHFVAAMLLKLEDALYRNEQLLPEFSGFAGLARIDLRFFCNAQRFKPAEYTAEILRLFEEGLKRLARLSDIPLYIDVDDDDLEIDQ